MASLIMHLAISNKLKKIYNFSDEFLVGSIAPDLLKKIYTKDKTHYTKQVQLEGEIRRYPDIERFLKENSERKDEYFLGYLVHLVQDKIWFDEYIPKVIKRISENECIYLKNNMKFSEAEATQRLYMDYSITGEYVFEKYDKIDLLKLKEYSKNYFKNNIKINIDEIIDNEKIIYETPENKELALFNYNLIDDYIKYSMAECQKYINNINGSK